MTTIFESGESKVMVVYWNDKVTEEELKQFKKDGGVGIVQACRESRVPEQRIFDSGLLFKLVPSFAEHSVAELGLLFMLWFSRLERNKKSLNFKVGTELYTKQAVVIGSQGKIGAVLCDKLRGLGMTVHGWDISDESATKIKLKRLLRRASFVFVCIPYAGNEGFFHLDFFKGMRFSPVVINLARTELIEFYMIQKALDKGFISAYAVDGYIPQFLLEDGRVFGTSHVGSITAEAQNRQKHFINQAVQQLLNLSD